MKIVGVILPIYKEPIEFVKKSIDSIINQTYKNIILVVIVDNPDNIEAIRYVNNLEDQRIKMIVNKTNLGLVKSLNIGLEYLQDKCFYIARMDADDFSYPDRILKQVTFLEKNNLDFIGANVRCFCDESTLFISNVPSEYNEIIRKYKYVNCFFHPTFLFKTSIILNFRYLNVPYCEDYVFTSQLISKGFKLGNCTEVLVDYRSNPQGISNENSSKQRVYFQYISKKFKNGNFSYEEFQSYIKEEKTKNKVKKCKNYFSLKNQMKYMNKQKRIIFGFKLFFLSPSMFIYDLKNRIFFKIIK